MDKHLFDMVSMGCYVCFDPPDNGECEFTAQREYYDSDGMWHAHTVCEAGSTPEEAFIKGYNKMAEHFGWGLIERENK